MIPATANEVWGIELHLVAFRFGFAHVLRLLGLLLALVMLLASLSAQAADGKRVALVIGNSAYTNGGSLPNPANDAALIVKKAREAGFEVVPANDLNYAAFKQALIDFRRKADTAQVAMIYYAGHGIEANGDNWLIPVDASLGDSRDLSSQAIRLSDVVDNLSRAEMRIILLDACRNNPFKEKWISTTRSFVGLERVEATPGSLVIMAADPGSTISDGREGENSYFAQALANRLVEPGLALQMLGNKVSDDVFKISGGRQRPAAANSLGGSEYYLVAKAVAPENGMDADDAAYFKAQQIGTAEAYLDYLTKFPNGKSKQFAQQIFTALSKAKAGQPSPPRQDPPQPLPPQPTPPPVEVVTAPPRPQPQFAAVKLLPGIPSAPTFALSGYPDCRNAWQSATDQASAINTCLQSYETYQAGVLKPFALRMNDHLAQVQALDANTVQIDPFYSDAQKAEFKNSVQQRVREASSGGFLMQSYQGALTQWDSDTSYLAQTLKGLQSVTLSLPYRAPQMVRRYEADGFPILPDPPAFALGPYPNCKGNWLSVVDVLARVQATIDCKNAYNEYRSKWLNPYREAMNANVTMANQIYTEEVSRFNVPGAFERVSRFQQSVEQRGKDVGDGGRLMTDYQAALARWQADFNEVDDSYNRATGCKGYPTPAGLAKNPYC